MKKSPLYLVDASIYIFRSWFSMPESIRNEQGESINALYGYLLFISKLLQQVKSRQLAFAFDESLESCFRNKIYPLYKSSRGLPDDNLSFQLKACRKLTEAIGLPCFSSKRYEADDLIGSLAAQLRNSASRIVIVSRDKDLGQLLRGRDELWDFASEERYSVTSFTEKFNVPPKAFADYLALVGDPVDDIPGVPGIGPKAAAHLLLEFGSLENVFANLEKISSMKLRGAQSLQNKLQAEQEMAFISYELARIYCDLNLVNDLSELVWPGLNQKSYLSALTRFGVKGRTRLALENAFSEF